MLSEREFCTAVYLLEKFTEGWPLPSRLPTGIHLDEPPTPAGKVFAPELFGSGESSWRLPQGSLPPTDFVFKPGQSSAHDCYALSTTSERHLQDPLSPVKISPGRSSCISFNSITPHANSRFLNQNWEISEEALKPTLTESDKLVTRQVADFSKRIMSQKEKAEYYRSKLQEIVLFKSQRSDKLAEMTEKVNACKHEANTLNQQCHKMSKSASDVETEIAAEFPTLKHIQEKKRELSQALLRLDSESRVSDSHFQTQLDHIAVHLRKLTKMLLVRAKSLGVEIKRQLPKNTPFGWQANIQENAAEWEKGWDTFNDEAFPEVQEHISPTPEESLLAIFTGEVSAAASAKVEEVRALELDIVDCRLQLEPSQEHSSVLESSDTPSASIRPTGASTEKLMHTPVYNEKPGSTNEDKAVHINFRTVPGSTVVAEALTRDAADSHPPLVAESAIETFTTVGVTSTSAISVPPSRSQAGAESSSEVRSSDAFGGWKMGQNDDNADPSLRSAWDQLQSSSRSIQSPASEIKASGRASRDSSGSFDPEDYFDLFPPRDLKMPSLSGRSLAMASDRAVNCKIPAGNDNFETFGFLVYTIKESSESSPIFTTSPAQPPVITDLGPHEYPREGLTVFDESGSDAASPSVSGK